MPPPPPPSGSNPWNLDRLSATGRHFLLEPQSRGKIVHELQHRLQQEQQKRHELLRSSNNATGSGGQLQDDNRQESEEITNLQQSDEAPKSVDASSPPAKSDSTNKPVQAASTTPPAPPPPPPPPVPPKPGQRNKTSDLLLPTSRLNLKSRDSSAKFGGEGSMQNKDLSSQAGVEAKQDEMKATSPAQGSPRAESRLNKSVLDKDLNVVAQVSQAQEKEDKTQEDKDPVTSRLQSQYQTKLERRASQGKDRIAQELKPARPSSQTILDEVKNQIRKLSADDTDNTVEAKSQRKAVSKSPRLSSQAVFEEVKSRHSKLSDEIDATDKANTDAPRLSTRQIFDEIKERRSDLLVASEASQAELSNDNPVESKKYKSDKYLHFDEAQLSIRATNGSLRPDNADAGRNSSPSAGALFGSSLRPDQNSRRLRAAGVKTRPYSLDEPLKQSNADGYATRDSGEVDQLLAHQRYGRSRLTIASPMEEARRQSGGYRAPSPAGEFRDSDGWDEAGRPRIGAPRLAADYGNPMNADWPTAMQGTSVAHQEAVRMAASADGSLCLTCLMRCLRNSGLLSSCWKTAIFELEEAFALKAVADAAVAGAGAIASSLPSYRQQPFHQLCENPALQREFDLPSATDEVTKWQALERLCSLQNSLRSCSHVCR